MREVGGFPIRILVTLGATLLVLSVATPGGALGGYAGAGWSTIEDHNGGCDHHAPTEIAIHPGADGRWSLLLQMVYGFPIDTCAGTSWGSTTWPSFLAGDLDGSPDVGLHGAGGPSLAGRAWELDVSPVGLETTWSLHTFGIIEGYGDYHEWWNGTAVMAGAHV